MSSHKEWTSLYNVYRANTSIGELQNAIHKKCRDVLPACGPGQLKLYDITLEENDAMDANIKRFLGTDPPPKPMMFTHSVAEYPQVQQKAKYFHSRGYTRYAHRSCTLLALKLTPVLIALGLVPPPNSTYYSSPDLRHTPEKSSSEIDANIEAFMDLHRPRMEELVGEASDITKFLPSWKSSHPDEAIRAYIDDDLKIPEVAGRPSLLLHNIGAGSLDKEHEQRINAVYTGFVCVLLVLSESLSSHHFCI